MGHSDFIVSKSLKRDKVSHSDIYIYIYIYIDIDIDIYIYIYIYILLSGHAKRCFHKILQTFIE